MVYDAIVALPSRRLSVARDALDIVLRHLEAMAPSPKVEELRARAAEYLRELDGWKVSPPATADKDKLMKRVLKLHTEVAKLEREGPAS